MPEIDPTRVCAAMLVWDVGLEDPDGPSAMIETVIKTLVGGRPAWRITHRSADPAEGQFFDVFDVDAASILPLWSSWQSTGSTLELSFAVDRVKLRRSDGADVSVEEIQLSEPVWPEGPGGKVFLAALPLEPGYHTRYRMVDRWDGEAESRVKTVDLAVERISRLNTTAGPKDVLEVRIEPPDESFHIRTFVRAKDPHYPWRTEYERGSTKMTSEVRTMALDHDSALEPGGGLEH